MVCLARAFSGLLVPGGGNFRASVGAIFDATSNQMAPVGVNAQHIWIADDNQCSTVYNNNNNNN